MEHSAGFLAVVNDAKSRINEISIEQYQADYANTPHVLIDVREDNEWQKGAIAGARHLGKGILERDIEQRQPDKNEVLVLYCGGGFRSALAADMLVKMGYLNVVSLDGGFHRWQELNLPTVRVAP